ncbi:hypothetical protein [Planomonospora algeriensis]
MAPAVYAVTVFGQLADTEVSQISYVRPLLVASQAHQAHQPHPAAAVHVWTAGAGRPRVGVTRQTVISVE